MPHIHTFAANMKKLGNETISLTVPFFFVSGPRNIFISFMFGLLSLMGFKMVQEVKMLLKIATEKRVMRKGVDCLFFFSTEGKHRDRRADSWLV